MNQAGTLELLLLYPRTKCSGILVEPKVVEELVVWTRGCRGREVVVWIGGLQAEPHRIQCLENRWVKPLFELISSWNLPSDSSLYLVEKLIFGFFIVFSLGISKSSWFHCKPQWFHFVNSFKKKTISFWVAERLNLLKIGWIPEMWYSCS